MFPGLAKPDPYKWTIGGLPEIEHSLDRGAKANPEFTHRQPCTSHTAIGETLDFINCGNLIRVPPRIETVCRAYARRHPAEAHWMEGILKFRKSVARGQPIPLCGQHL